MYIDRKGNCDGGTVLLMESLIELQNVTAMKRFADLHTKVD
jgi:hypothetical protein